MAEHSEIERYMSSDDVKFEMVKEHMEEAITLAKEAEIVKFNTIVREFLKGLIREFPFLEMKLKMAYTQYLIATKMNKAFGIQQFTTHVVPLGYKIMEKDASFFLEDATRIPIVQDLGLKTAWPKASAAAIEMIWGKTGNLLETVEKYSFMEKAGSHALNESALKAVESTWKKLNMADRKDPPKLEDLVDSLVTEMSTTGEALYLNGNTQETKNRMLQIARELLPAQMETIKRFSQQQQPLGDAHGAEALRRKRAQLLAQLAKI